MSHASTKLLRAVMAMIVALGLTLPAVGGTMAQGGEDEDHGTPSAIEVAPSGNRSPMLGIDPGDSYELRGKILRITPTDDGG